MPDVSDASPPRVDRPAAESGSLSRLLGRLRRLLRSHNAEDLREAIEDLIEHRNGDETEIRQDELVLLHNVLDLRNRTASDAMVPRVDIDAVEISTPLIEVIRQMNRTAHTRLPVYRETLDHVVGMVHIKDVMACWENPHATKLSTIVRRLLFVAPSMPVLELLLQMQVSRIHMALVVDEHGGTDGLITIEDLVEQIVGEIEDEHDEEVEPQVIEQPDGTYLADARVPVDEFEKRVGPFLTADEREDVETLGGLAFYVAGRVPARGEVIRHSTGIEFEVVEADPRRVRKLRVSNLPPKAAEG
jgi:hemolysin (HlyC) family protein